jgi:glyoxylase-like metal-dependent hydrolase (beta-lactamase superfamily II)
MMFRKAILAAAFAALITGCTAMEEGGDAGAAAAPEPIDAVAAVTDAALAMGAEDMTSITYSGTAWQVPNFGQWQNATGPWEGRDVQNYTRSIDFESVASLATGETTEQPYNQAATADSGWAQQLEIWITPWGFLKGAAANVTDSGATAVSQMIDGQQYNVISWTADEMAPSGLNYTVIGYVNADTNLIDRVETHVADNVMGDKLIQNNYSNYMDVDGIQVPGEITQIQGGHPVFEATVADATINPADIATAVAPPAAGGGGRGGRGGRGGGGGAPDEPQELSEMLAPGVYRITTPYQALAVEMDDHIVIFEGGQSPANGENVITEAKRVIPDKPIRYVVNSHPHFDHAGGLAPFVAEGATVITHDNNAEFLTMALNTPRTLVGDRLATADRTATVEGVSDRRVLSDDTNTIELIHIENLGHTNGMLVGLLPEHGVLFQADFTLPQPGAEPNPFVITLARQVVDQNIEFEGYYGVHAAQTAQTRDDLVAVLD